jgi:hypothetical protein
MGDICADIVEYTQYAYVFRKTLDITMVFVYHFITHICLQIHFKYRKCTLSISCIGAKWRIVGVFRELQWGLFGSNLCDIDLFETYLIL